MNSCYPRILSQTNYSKSLLQVWEVGFRWLSHWWMSCKSVTVFLRSKVMRLIQEAQLLQVVGVQKTDGWCWGGDWRRIWSSCFSKPSKCYNINDFGEPKFCPNPSFYRGENTLSLREGAIIQDSWSSTLLGRLLKFGFWGSGQSLLTGLSQVFRMNIEIEYFNLKLNFEILNWIFSIQFKISNKFNFKLN